MVLHGKVYITFPHSGRLLILLISDQGYNPAAEAFKNFDQDQSNSLLGSLHLDPEEEPRRANSVRFDESALHGHFAHGSRSSTDFLPSRTGSGFGSHPMIERSSSHKSDGRQSSAGQSNQSARASSFGFEPRPLSAAVAPFVPLGPPPGLFILGPVPSIIRCWLDTNFSNEALLYAAVCTGSYRSVLGLQLVSHLCLRDQITTNREGLRTLKIPVYLPEATIQHSSSHSNSPAPQLPTLTVEFLVQDSSSTTEAIQIFIGSDVLRARNADIHFSLDRLTLFDDERNKLSVPMVRPEKATLFKNLLTTSTAVNTPSSAPVLKPGTQANKSETNSGDTEGPKLKLLTSMKDDELHEANRGLQPTAGSAATALSPSVIGEGRKSTEGPNISETSLSARADTDLRDSESSVNGNTPDTPSKSESGSIWGSWRRDSALSGRQDSVLSTTNTTSGYQRAGRGRSMKILKPARLNTSRTTSATQPPVGFDAAPARLGDAGKRSNQATPTENHDSQSLALDGRSSSSEAKAPFPTLTNKSRQSNPIGGASAFGWLNSGQQKQLPTSND